MLNTTETKHNAPISCNPKYLQYWIYRGAYRGGFTNKMALQVEGNFPPLKFLFFPHTPVGNGFILVRR